MPLSAIQQETLRKWIWEKVCILIDKIDVISLNSDWNFIDLLPAATTPLLGIAAEEGESAEHWLEMCTVKTPTCSSTLARGGPLSPFSVELLTRAITPKQYFDGNSMQHVRNFRTHLMTGGRRNSDAEKSLVKVLIEFNAVVSCLPQAYALFLMDCISQQRASKMYTIPPLPCGVEAEGKGKRSKVYYEQTVQEIADFVRENTLAIANTALVRKVREVQERNKSLSAERDAVGRGEGDLFKQGQSAQLDQLLEKSFLEDLEASKLVLLCREIKNPTTQFEKLVRTFDKIYNMGCNPAAYECAKIMLSNKQQLDARMISSLEECCGWLKAQIDFLPRRSSSFWSCRKAEAEDPKPVFVNGLLIDIGGHVGYPQIVDAPGAVTLSYVSVVAGGASRL